MASPGLHRLPLPPRKAVTVPLENYFAVPALGAGFALALINFLSYSRLPNWMYLGFALLQLGVIVTQVMRRNLLTAVMGLCMTSILLLAAIIERARFKDFDYALAQFVYRSENVSAAFSVLLACTCFYHALTLRLVPDLPWSWKAPDAAEKSFGKATTWLFYIFGTGLLALTVPGGFISDVSYGTAAHASEAGLLASNGGLSLLASVLITFALVTACRLYGFGSLRFKFAAAGAFASITYFRLMRGSRGGSISIFATLAFLFYMNSRLKPWRRNAVLGAGLVLTFIFFNTMAEVRATAHTRDILGAFSDSIGSSSALLDHPMEINLLPQSYWHLLHCIDLYNLNVRLDGHTFANLIPESIPEDISRLFGYERPLSSSWLLAGYRIHGGGMFVIAEGFWNFGIWGAVLVTGVLAVIAIKLERWFREQEPILSCSYFAFLGTFGFGLFYGLQGFARAFEMSVALALVMRFFMKFFRRRMEYRLRTAQAVAEMRRAMLAGRK